MLKYTPTSVSPTGLKFTPTSVCPMGLKFTMDGSADGHTINSSIDEIIHNMIDLKASDIKIHSNKNKLWSFQFDVNTPIHDPDNKISHGVTYIPGTPQALPNDKNLRIIL